MPTAERRIETRHADFAMAWTTSSTDTLVSPAEHSLTATGLPGSLFRIATNVFAYVLQRFFVARLNPHGRACSTESLLVSYRPLALELSSSRARRNPPGLCLTGIREIRGLPGYAKYYRVLWKTRSRCLRAAGQHRSEVTSSGSSIPPFRRSYDRSLNEQPYRDRSTTHRVRGNAHWGRCHHVIYNTESGSLLLDNEKRNQDYQQQYDAIGGV